MSNQNPYDVVDLSKPTDEIIINLVNKHNPNLWNDAGGLDIPLTTTNAEVLEVETFGVEGSVYYGDTRARVHSLTDKGYRGWIWVYYYRVNLQEFVTNVFDGRVPAYRVMEGQTVGEFVEESLSHSSVLALDPGGIKNRNDIIPVKNPDGSLMDSATVTLIMEDDDPVFRGSADIHYYPSLGIADPIVADIYPNIDGRVDLYFTTDRLDGLAIDWGDGTVYQNLSGPLGSHYSHTYTAADLPLGQDFFQLKVNRVDSVTDVAFRITSSGLVTLESFGNIRTINEISFRNSENLIEVPESIPRTLTSFKNMFWGCIKFNSANVSSWDTSNCTSMYRMFQNIAYFNQNLNNWDTSQVTDMYAMFYSIPSFNQPLNNWDTSQVVDMSYMFWAASSFNQDISMWDVSSVTEHFHFNSTSISPEYLPVFEPDGV